MTPTPGLYKLEHVDAETVRLTPLPSPAPEWPKCYSRRGCDHEDIYVLWSPISGVNMEHGRVTDITGDGWLTESYNWSSCCTLITDPTLRAKYIAAAEAWREKQKQPSPAQAEEPPYPRVYRDEGFGDTRVYLAQGEVGHHFDRNGKDWQETKLTAKECEEDKLTLLTGPEAAEYVAAAREGRDAVWPPNSSETPNSSPAPLPTAEEVAETIIAQQCGIGRPAKYDPDQHVRLSYAAGLIANAIHRDRRSRESSELAKPECRVKHDWTGAMGTVLMEHGGTSFVKWDDGQVTSVYSRHLQKELV